MDWEVRDQIIDDMDLSKGFRDALNEVIADAHESKADGSIDRREYTATQTQMKAIRDRMTRGETKKTHKVTKNGREYIKVGEKDYRRFLRKKDVFVTSTGAKLIRDEDGNAKPLEEDFEPE